MTARPIATRRVTFSGLKRAFGAGIELAKHVAFDYAIGASVGHKSLTRQSFGARAANTPGRGDMWWGGVNQNGWGIALLQQFNALFAVWFTYDAGGAATWYVMPAGAWTNSDTYEGRMYSTTGSAWVGRVYNPAQLAVTDVGPFKLRFLSADNITLDYSVQGRAGTLFLDRQPF